MAARLELKGNIKNMSHGRHFPVLLVTVWRKDNKMPDGQVEIYSERGESVVVSGSEWLDFAETIADALRATGETNAN